MTNVTTNNANAVYDTINYFTESETITQPVYHTYKDRVFRLLFKDKKRLLMLYNALNDTDYTNEDDLIINTLENAIFLKMNKARLGSLTCKNFNKFLLAVHYTSAL